MSLLSVPQRSFAHEPPEPPGPGRFLSPDPFIDWGLVTQGVNRYGYVGNNPLNRIDPSGLCADQITTRTEDVCMDAFGGVEFTLFRPTGPFGRGVSSAGFTVSGSSFGGYRGAGPPSGGGGGGRGNGSGGGNDTSSSDPPSPEAEEEAEDRQIDAVLCHAGNAVANFADTLVSCSGCNFPC